MGGKDIRVTPLLILTLVMLCTCNGSNDLHPLILVPAIAGSQLEVRLTEEYAPSSERCNRRDDDWFRLWFSPDVTLSPMCFSERMKLYYDHSVDDYRNARGVESRVPHFGSTRSLVCLDPDPLFRSLTLYMEFLVESLEKIGYVEGDTLFGAPYDFRYGLAAEGHPSYVGSKFLQELKDLTENASVSNGGKPAILLSHSLGSLFVLQLLNRNPHSWRQKYVKHFVALSTPWAGAVTEILAFASGYTFGTPLINPLTIREVERTFESSLWLLPTPELFGHHKPLLVTPNATYTAFDMAQFLNDLGFPQKIHPYRSRILPLVERLTAPEVPVTNVIGTGVPTPESLVYGDGDFDKQPGIVYGDGDGTVNVASLVAVESEWAGEKNQSLTTLKIPGVSHAGILADDAALEIIIGEICSINGNQLEWTPMSTRAGKASV